jgi:hypothetical protein
VRESAVRRLTVRLLHGSIRLIESCPRVDAISMKPALKPMPIEAPRALGSRFAWDTEAHVGCVKAYSGRPKE